MLCDIFFFFKQKTAYEMRISDWSSDVCSSDLSKHSDLEAAIKIAAEMEQFVLRGSGADGCAGARPAEVIVTGAAQPGEGFLPGERAVPRDLLYHKVNRSEERRVGKECVRTCRSRWTPYHYKKTKRKIAYDTKINRK